MILDNELKLRRRHFVGTLTGNLVNIWGDCRPSHVLSQGPFEALESVPKSFAIPVTLGGLHRISLGMNGWPHFGESLCVLLSVQACSDLVHEVQQVLHVSPWDTRIESLQAPTANQTCVANWHPVSVRHTHTNRWPVSSQSQSQCWT